MKLRTLDLFSGIGGFSLGLESTGFFETIGFVEKDKFCQKVLKKHWSNINIEEDIRNVKGEKYQADVVTGGFPCQPFSVAGKRKSTADDRYLWDEMLRVIRETKPRWVIGENVEGIVNINEGMVLRQVLNDLENEGFKSQCIIIPASGIGAWHQRKRIWIMAYSHSNRYVSEIRRGNGEEKGIPVQDRQKDSTSRQPIGTSDVWQTNKEYVPNTSGQRSSSQSIGVNRELAEESKGEKETRNKSTLRTSSLCSDVPNTNTRLSIRENEEIQSRGNAITNGSEDVSNSNSWLRGGRGTELKSGDDREGWIYTEKEKQTRKHIRCKTIGCNAVLGEDVPNSNGEGSQRYKLQHNLETGKQISEHNGEGSSERQQTWWQTQSELCGVPNGVSYELDKDRSNRIKSLGNSIVPQIARQIGLSIMEAELNG
jgi:DNA (cytosine-5)-methyltransferase 1